jgi:hypothetical protein
MSTDEICSEDMSYEECETALLRNAVDLAQKKVNKRIVSSPDIKNMIRIVEEFIKKKNLIPYGGIAINNILPQEDQFYDNSVDLADYDVFSTRALDDAKELANLFYKKGYREIEAKAGQHYGTYKVFVNYLPVFDVTQINKTLFEAIKKEAILVNGIRYTPPNFLRMSMYGELSRPMGDTDRWTKVHKRLSLLNKHYPLTQKQCSHIEFQRKMGDKQMGKDVIEEIYSSVKQTFIQQRVVFFGGYAISLYSAYMPIKMKEQFKHIPDFDVIADDPETTAEIIKLRLEKIPGITEIKIIKRDSIDDVLPEHYEIKVGDDTIAFIYKPLHCYSYNVIEVEKQKIKIATIDTMLSFYLSFLYAKRDYYDTDRIICMSQYLFHVQQKNRLKQKGLLKRFSINCYGHEHTLEEMRAEKSKRFMELSKKRGTREFEEHFLNYRPGNEDKKRDGKNKPIKEPSSNATKTIKEKSIKEKSTKAKKTKKKRKI